MLVDWLQVGSGDRSNYRGVEEDGPKLAGSQEGQTKEKTKWMVTEEQLWKVWQLLSQSQACAEKIEEYEALGNWKVRRLGGSPSGLQL